MRAACLACLAASVLTAACTPHHTGFSTDNARAHLRRLATDIGPRPAGTEANARARAYLASELARLGFDVRIQSAEARRPEIGLTGWVHNVLAVSPGRSPDAIGLVAHYDSVDRSPGAGDDALGVAVALEAARVLAVPGERRWTLQVLLTDGEEDGLLGAAALVEDRAVRERLKAYINMDSTGGDSPVVLFEAGPGNGWLISAWARTALRPRGASYLGEIYRRLPNDTDFSVFARVGIPGLNLAAVGDAYGYHLPIDGAARVTDRVIRDMGDAVVSVAAGLDGEDITRRSVTSASYFDIAGVTAVTWAPRVDLVLAVLAAGLGLLAVGRCLRDLWARGRLHAVTWTLFWAAGGVALVFAAMAGTVTLLRASREVYHPWYAHPGRLLLLLALVGATTGWATFRLAAWPRLRWRPPRAASTVWLPSLAVWTGLAVALARWAPAAAFVCVLPLLAAAVPLALGGFRRRAVLAAAVLSTTAAGVLLLREAILFGEYIPPLLGGAGIVTPTWVFPALIAALGVMLVPPVLAACAAEGLGRPRFVTRALALATVTAFAWSFSAPAYTPLRPLRVSVGQLTTPADGGPANIVMSSSEPILEFGGPAPLLVPGVPQPPALRRLVRGAFVASGRVPAADPPAAVTVSTAPVDDGVALRVRVVPGEPGLFVVIELPAGLVPVRSTHPGAVSGGRWRAMHAAVPSPAGLDCEIVIAPDDAAAARDGRVLVQARRRPQAADTARAPERQETAAVAHAYRLWHAWPLR